MLLAVLAAVHRPRPPEPLPPPSYAVVFESGAPDRPAEPAEADGPPEQARQAAPPPAISAPMPPVAEMPSPPAAEPPPSPPPLPQAEPVPAPAQLAESLAEPPPVSVTPTPDRSSPAPRQEQQLAALPLPPPPLPRPQPPPQQALPGLWLPEAASLARPRPPEPGGRTPASARAPLDLTLGRIVGRMTPEPEAKVRGAKVGPSWLNAFRAWVEENKRYPEMAVLFGQQGSSRVEVLVAPDGQVRAVRLIRSSGSPWLDAGLVNMFRGARLPPFPPGADPGGVSLDFTMHYILVSN